MQISGLFFVSLSTQTTSRFSCFQREMTRRGISRVAVASHKKVALFPLKRVRVRVVRGCLQRRAIQQYGNFPESITLSGHLGFFSSWASDKKSPNFLTVLLLLPLCVRDRVRVASSTGARRE